MRGCPQNFHPSEWVVRQKTWPDQNTPGGQVYGVPGSLFYPAG